MPKKKDPSLGTGGAESVAEIKRQHKARLAEVERQMAPKAPAPEAPKKKKKIRDPLADLDRQLEESKEVQKKLRK